MGDNATSLPDDSIQDADALAEWLVDTGCVSRAQSGALADDLLRANFVRIVPKSQVVTLEHIRNVVAMRLMPGLDEEWADAAIKTLDAAIAREQSKDALAEVKEFVDRNLGVNDSNAADFSHGFYTACRFIDALLKGEVYDGAEPKATVQASGRVTKCDEGECDEDAVLGYCAKHYAIKFEITDEMVERALDGHYAPKYWRNHPGANGFRAEMRKTLTAALNG